MFGRTRSIFPDFLVIGLQRTGTSWLFSNLRLHPPITMRHVKEVLFFNRFDKPDQPRFRSSDLEWYLDHFNEPPLRVLAKNLQCLRDYRRLYRPAIQGEASASYGAMDTRIIDEIVTINPDIKAILMIRDPVERAWSHAKKDLVRDVGRKLADVPDSKFEKFFGRPYQLRCARYAENHDNWAERLRPGNMLVGDFEDISRCPEDLLGRILAFVGADSDKRYVGGLARQSVNATGGTGFPRSGVPGFWNYLVRPEQSSQATSGMV